MSVGRGRVLDRPRRREGIANVEPDESMVRNDVRARPEARGRALNALLILAASALTVAAMRELSWLITPLLVSGLLAVLVYPIYAWLVARRVPRPVALTILLSAAYGLLIGLGAVIVYASSGSLRWSPTMLIVSKRYS